jgi:hypothetical protein
MHFFQWEGIARARARFLLSSFLFFSFLFFSRGNFSKNAVDFPGLF